jgi:SRSO17 transposase
MDLVTSFAFLLQGLAVVMTAPTFRNFIHLVPGWLLAPKRTVTGMIVAAGLAGGKHHSAFHRIFATAQWSLDELGLAVFRQILPWLDKEMVLLGIDDTLARKRGLKMFGVGMHHDPLLSSRGYTVTNWGHSWVVLGVIVRFPLWPDRAFCLPILFRLYLNKQKAAKHRRVYRSRPELAVQLLHLLCKRFANRRFNAIADSAYGGQSVLANLPDNCDLTSRLVLNARLYDAPPPSRGKRGRPRRRGKKLPTPKEMLEKRARHTSLNIYGRRQKMRVRDTVARTFKSPDIPLRVVVVQALLGGRGREAFFSTCVTASAKQVLIWYSWRWSIEQAFRDSKQHLGFEQPQGWSRRAVERTAPLAMILYSVIVLWFVEYGHRAYREIHRPWYTSKQHPSFADMLITLRRESAREYISTLALTGRGSRKITRLIEQLTQTAA